MEHTRHVLGRGAFLSAHDEAAARVAVFLDLMDSWRGKPGYADELYTLNELPLRRSDLRLLLEAASVERAVVEAQALEQAADAAQRLIANKQGGFSHWLRERAAKIREGQK